MLFFFFFFFSSRRRHTRFSRDWSSDVCSSDLDWRIAARGATAALLTQDARALAHFRQALAGHPWLLQLDAQELETRVEDPLVRQEAWLRALRAADDDGHR